MALSSFKTLTLANGLSKKTNFWDQSSSFSHVTNGLTLYADASSGVSLRENLVTYSEQLDNSIWFKESSVSVSANATTDPLGGNTADKVIELTNNGSHRFYQGTASAENALYTFSYYAKASERSRTLILIQDINGNQSGISVDLSTGLRISAPVAEPRSWQIQALSNGWYRLSVTVFSGGNGTIYGIPHILNDSGSVSYAGNGSSGLFIWGIQLERSFSVGTYTQTVASATNKSSQSIFYDISGNNNNFTLFNSPTYSAANGGSIVFNGTNQYGVSSANAIGTSSSAAFTMEAFAMTATGSSWQTVFGTQTGYKQIGFLNLGFFAGVNGGAGGLVPFGSSIAINAWFHLAMTTTGDSNANFYLNGELVKSNIAIGTNGNSNGVQTLSTYTSTSGAEMLNGRIGLVRAYNRALSAAEISKNFEANRERFGI